MWGESESSDGLATLLLVTSEETIRADCSRRESSTFSTSCLVPTEIQPMANSQIKLVAVTRMMKSLVLRECMIRLPSFGIPNRVRFRSPACQVLRAGYGRELRRCYSLFLPATHTSVPPACPLTGLYRDDP